MLAIRPQRTRLRTWTEIMESEIQTNNPFLPYTAICAELNVTIDDALQRMWDLYEDAITSYTAGTIFIIFADNLKANADKYAQLIELYQDDLKLFGDYYRNEDYKHKRLPNLSSSSSSTGSGSASTKNNQTQSTTTTPNQYTNTTVHNVVPFDATTGERKEYEDVSTESGTRTTATSYTGSPDTTTTSSTASSTVTTTGTDQNEYTKIISGRDGRRPTSEVIADGIKATSYLDILDIIINDIADQIFLQVWL